MITILYSYTPGFAKYIFLKQKLNSKMEIIYNVQEATLNMVHS